MSDSCCWRSYEPCDLLMYGKEVYKDCPCNKCVIKVMCSDICDEFNDYYKSIFNFDHEGKKQ